MYISKVLKLHGIAMRHQSVGRHGTVDWKMATRFGECAVCTKLRRRLDAADQIVHQVRDPIATIGSMQAIGINNWGWIYRHSRVSEGPTRAVTCARLWYYWNLQAEALTTFRYRVENLEAQLSELCALLGIEPKPEVLKHVPKNTNSRAGEYEPVTRKEIEEADEDTWVQVRMLAVRYGYDY